MRKVIIIGCGRVGFRLIQLLKVQKKYEITLIENNEDAIKHIDKDQENLNIIVGDATNKRVLESAGISEADILVATTSTDEVNLLIGILAQNYNLEKVIARTSNPSHIKMFKKIGLNEVVSPELAACSDIEKLIISPQIAEIALSGKGDCELLDLPIKSKRVIGKRIGDISPNKNFIVIMYHDNNEEVLLATNDIILEKNNKVTILAKRKAVKKTINYFTKNRLLHF